MSLKVPPKLGILVTRDWLMAINFKQLKIKRAILAFKNLKWTNEHFFNIFMFYI